MFLAVIGGSDKGTTLYVIQSQFVADFAIFCEFIRMHETCNGQVFTRGLEILPDRDHIHAIITEVPQGGNYFVPRFTEAKHDAGLGPHTTLLEITEHFHASPVFGLDSHLTGHAFDRFDVMRYHFGCGVDDVLNVVLFALEVRDQGFEGRFRIEGLYCTDRILPDDAASVL